MKVKELFDELSTASQEFAAIGHVAQWLSENRDSFVLQLHAGAYQNVRAMLRGLCEQYPPAVGVVAWLMTQDVDASIGAVSLYDPQLGQSLTDCRDNFATLQKQWAASHPSV